MWFTSTSFTTGTIFGIESVLTIVSTLFIYLNFVCHLVIYKVSPFCHLSILSLIYILSILVSCIYSFFTTSTGISTGTSIVFVMVLHAENNKIVITINTNFFILQIYNK